MADNLTANENMMGHLDCIRGKDIFRGYNWNGTDHTGEQVLMILATYGEGPIPRGVKLSNMLQLLEQLLLFIHQKIRGTILEITQRKLLSKGLPITPIATINWGVLSSSFGKNLFKITILYHSYQLSLRYLVCLCLS